MSARGGGPLTLHTVRPGIGRENAGAAGLEIGLIGMCVCPGRTVRGARVAGWNRDVEADLDAVRDFGAAALVTLMQADELAEYTLPVDRLEQAVRARGMAWHHLPIFDMCAPDFEFEARWQAEGAALRAHLDAGRNIVVHCLGGLGRTGTIAARLLVEYGETPQDAIARVRDARPGAIQTVEQELHVLGCEPLADGGGDAG